MRKAWIDQQIGNRFGTLTAIRREPTVGGQPQVLVRCDCGNEKVVGCGNLRAGRIHSCGCVHRGRTHRMSHLPEFRVWIGMLNRCRKPRHAAFKYYGARGITVCERWLKFENFYADMGPRPPKTSVERIDNAGNYEPTNCRWATHLEQCQNTRRNRYVDFDGRRLSVTQWSRELDIPDHVIFRRLDAGYPIAEALNKTSFAGRRSDIVGIPGKT